MSKKGKLYSSNVKARMALAAIRGAETVSQLVACYGLHPTQINAWKKQLTSQASELLARGTGSKKASDHTVDDLHASLAN